MIIITILKDWEQVPDKAYQKDQAVPEATKGLKANLEAFIFFFLYST